MRWGAASCGCTTPWRWRRTRTTCSPRRPAASSPRSPVFLSSAGFLGPRPRGRAPRAMQRATAPRPAGASGGARYSASQFAEAARPWLRRTANGIPPHLLRDGRNERHRLLYASWPSSGLEELLSVFPHIRRQVQLRPAPRRDCAAPHHAPSNAHRALGWASQVPRVELHVYGGFDWWCAPRANEPALARTSQHSHDPAPARRAWRRQVGGARQVGDATVPGAGLVRRVARQDRRDARPGPRDARPPAPCPPQRGAASPPLQPIRRADRQAARGAGGRCIPRRRGTLGDGAGLRGLRVLKRPTPPNRLWALRARCGRR
jgi:hypothetical protein